MGHFEEYTGYVGYVVLQNFDRMPSSTGTNESSKIHMYTKLIDWSTDTRKGSFSDTG